MYDWLMKDRAGAAHDRQGDDNDLWTWTVIGLVALGTMLAVWLPLLLAAYRA